MIKVKHPKDMNQLAKHVVDLATGNAETHQASGKKQARRKKSKGSSRK